MLKYNKIIATLSIIVSFWSKFCHATESTDRLDDAERGFGNSIQISHQNPLRPKQLNEYNRAIVCTTDTPRELEARNGLSVTNDTPDRCMRFCQLENIFSSIYRTIDQRLHYYCSLPIVQEYVCQVAASVTSGVILYEIYQGFKIFMPH